MKLFFKEQFTFTNELYFLIKNTALATTFSGIKK